MISHVVITTLCDQMYLIGGMNDQSDYNDVWVLTSECELCTILFTAYVFTVYGDPQFQWSGELCDVI